MNDFVVTILLFIFILHRPLDDYLPSDALKVIPFLLVFLAFIRLSLFRRGKVYFGKGTKSTFVFVYISFFAVLMLSYVRNVYLSFTEIGAYTLPLQYTLIVAFTYLYFQRFSRNFTSNSELLRRSMLLIISPLIVFIFIDLCLYILGINAPASETGMEPKASLIGGLVGIDVARTHFLLGGNHNNYALTIGGVFLFCLLLSFNSTTYRQKLTFWLFCSFSAFCLLLTDVRGVVISLIIVLFLAYLVHKFAMSYLLYLFIIVPLLFTFFFDPLQDLLTSLGSDSISMLGRDGDAQDFLTFNNRTHIWRGALNFLADFEIVQLIGYGQVGHLSSQAYKEWDWIIPMAVTHNMYLQYILDAGYLGLVLLIIFLFYCLHMSIALYKSGYFEGLVFAAFFVYYAFSGTFEPALGTYNHPHTTLLLMTSLALGMLYGNLRAATEFSTDHEPQAVKSEH